VQAAFGLTRGGTVVSGVFQSSSKHIVAVDECRTEDIAAQKIIQTIRYMLPDFNIVPYNIETGAGMLRHVLVKRGFATGEIMVVLVVTDPVFPHKPQFVQELRRSHPEITTLLLNICPNRAPMLLGSREEVLFGRGYIEDSLCGTTFRISAGSFYQINPVQTEKLYNIAIDAANITERDTVVDAYCGIGTISLVAARRAKKVIGVELSSEAVRDAAVNARLNKIENAEFIKDDAGRFLSRLAKSGENVDILFLDPPRAGCSPAALKGALMLKPRRIVYVSCNPETLARDMELLTNEYAVKLIQPVDMFPHTRHVETVVLLLRK